MEKGSKYAFQCLKETLLPFDWSNIDELQCFSDGPRQFKSGSFMGTCRNSASTIDGDIIASVIE